MSAMINMSALAIRDLLESAQEQGVNLTLDTASLENQALIDSIERMSLDVLPSNRKRSTGLVSIDSTIMINPQKFVSGFSKR
jgi:hypothetical protein